MIMRSFTSKGKNVHKAIINKLSEIQTNPLHSQIIADMMSRGQG